MGSVQPISADRLAFWQDRITQQNGKSLFVPEELKAEWDQLNSERQTIQEKSLVIVKEQTMLTNKWQNWWLKMQLYLESNGHPDVWGKDVGEDETALKEGLAIVNITEPRRGGM